MGARPVSRCNPEGGPGSARVVCRISFASSGGRPNALSFCLYHDYRLRQEQGGEQRAEYFCPSHPDPSFLPVSRVVHNLVPSLVIQLPVSKSSSSPSHSP